MAENLEFGRALEGSKDKPTGPSLLDVSDAWRVKSNPPIVAKMETSRDLSQVGSASSALQDIAPEKRNRNQWADLTPSEVTRPYGAFSNFYSGGGAFKLFQSDDGTQRLNLQFGKVRETNDPPFTFNPESQVVQPPLGKGLFLQYKAKF